MSLETTPESSSDSTGGLVMSRSEVDVSDKSSGDLEAQTEYTDAKASLGKRKRDTDDTGTEAGSSAAQMTRVSGPLASSKRQATGSSMGKHPVDGQGSTAVPVIEDTASGMPHAANDKTTAVAENNVQPDSPNAASSHTSDGQQQAQQAIRIDLGAWSGQMKELQKNVEHAALGILACIGHISNMPCPLDSKPSAPLEAIYVRCWGAEWRAVATENLRLGRFAIPYATMSQISAFLYDKILNKQVYDKEVARDFVTRLQASGPTGEAILKVLDWSKRGKFLPV